jgi:hypothetical protein
VIILQPTVTSFDLLTRFTVFAGSIYHPFPPARPSSVWYAVGFFPLARLGRSACTRSSAVQTRVIIRSRATHPASTILSESPKFANTPIRGVNLFVLFVMSS